MSLDSAAERDTAAAEVAAVPRARAVETAQRAVSRARAAVRISSIDMLRGLVIVIMALDHVRHCFSNVHFDPLDLAQTTPGLFFTRWITHYCAPWAASRSLSSPGTTCSTTSIRLLSVRSRSPGSSCT